MTKNDAITVPIIYFEHSPLDYPPCHFLFLSLCYPQSKSAALLWVFDQAGSHEWISSLPTILLLIRVTIFIFKIVHCIAGNHAFTGTPAEHPLSRHGENKL
jgi:hypothetical protein